MAVITIGLNEIWVLWSLFEHLSVKKLRILEMSLIYIVFICLTWKGFHNFGRSKQEKCTDIYEVYVQLIS